MLGSAVLETAIGLVFVYLIFSLIASAIAEYISALFNRRAEHLKHILFNLFDTDDPQGRMILRLVITHPTLQALNSTDWKPKFQSAMERLVDQQKESQLVKRQWNAASRAVANASAARQAALKADDCATKVAAAVSGVKTALNKFIPANAGSSLELQNSVTIAETVAAAAWAAATAADQAATAALAAAEDVKKSRAQNASPTATVPAPTAVPSQLDPVPIPAGGDLKARAIAVIDRASQAAATATKSATRARNAAATAENAKKGLDSDLMDLVSVPKYIPDRIFADVLLHVLTADETISALSQEPNGSAQVSDLPDTAVSPFWGRFAAALGVVAGVASRLPEGDAKTNVNRRITALEDSLRNVEKGTAKATAVLAELENGGSGLRAAIAAVPDDAIRTALDREMDTSLRPLQGVGRDILLLERACAGNRSDGR